MATILVVDDRLTNREFLTTLLGYGGHRLLEAADGAEALAIAGSERPDLIIADILMPTMDGYELVHQLRADPALARTPVIFYTAHYHEQEARSLARACGVSCVLTKPAEPQTILNAVQAALGFAPPPAVPVAAAEFDREHLRLVTDKLAQKADELKRTNQRLSALVDLGLQLGSELDLRRLLQSFGHAAREIIGARHAITAIVDNHGPGLRFVFTSGMHPEAAARLGSPDPRTAVLRPVLTEGRCVRLRNPGGDAAAIGLSAAYPPVHALLAAPIVSPTRTYGWLGLIDKIGAEAFSDEDERLAAILAAQLGRVYQNGSLYADVLQHASDLEREMAERKEAQAKLRQAQERLQYVVSSNPALLFTLAIENNQIRGISWMSDNVVDMLGYPVSETHGTEWWKGHVHPDDLQTTMDTVDRDLFAKGFTAHEYRFRHRDGSYRWVRGEIRLLRDAAARPTEAVGSWSDITERKQLEEQFRQAQKMEAVGKLAGGVAHDFNNLLTVINGYGEVLMSSFHLGDPLRGFVEQICKAGERATSLTRQLLAFSRKQMLVPAVLDVNALLVDTEKMLSRLIGEDIDLKLATQKDLWLVKVDPGQMEQVVMNLVVNSRDAMPTGGKVTIETRNVELDLSYANLHADARPGRYVLLAVSDTGCGMDEATKSRIFEPFFSTKGEKGTGLGLATVFGIVKQSGGCIEVYSEPGIGTTFKIYLPCAVEQAAASKLHSGPPALLRGSETVLLVEDEEGVRSLTKLVLERSGYQVLEARNGGEALLLCQQHPGTIHIMVTDVVMPKMSGQALAMHLASMRPDMKVLYLSGYTDEAIVHHGVIGPDTPFLHKPFTTDALLRKVREVLGSDDSPRFELP